MSKWREVVGAVAPTVGRALGGPLGGVAGTVVARTVLGKDQASDRELDAALVNANPEMLMRLRQAEHEFEQQMAQLGVDLERVAASDRASARERETVVGGWAAPTLAAAVIAGFFASVFLVLLGFAQVESAVAGALIGYVSAKAEQVVSYYFGSSAGSADKNRLLGSLRK